MRRHRRIAVPAFVRIKPGALDRLGLYLRRWRVGAVQVLCSEGLPDAIAQRLREAHPHRGATWIPVADNHTRTVEAIVQQTRRRVPVVGLGGGKALDVAKAVAHAQGALLVLVPTSLSTDGFASPNASLIGADGRRTSVPLRVPGAVVIDTDIVKSAPRVLWCSGVGDLVAKVTAVADWKLAYHEAGTPVEDMAALLSDAAVYQFLGRPTCDTEGIRLLATALLLNGVAMALSGSSRPASGSEHLISHALDELTQSPRLHGLQVGVATYLCACLHALRRDSHADGTPRAELPGRVRTTLDAAGFREELARDPFNREEWRRAFRRAPHVKQNWHTILAHEWALPALDRLLAEDPWLAPCFHGS